FGVGVALRLGGLLGAGPEFFDDGGEAVAEVRGRGGQRRAHDAPPTGSTATMVSASHHAIPGVGSSATSVAYTITTPPARSVRTCTRHRTGLPPGPGEGPRMSMQH